MHSPTPVIPSSVVISTIVAVNVPYEPAPNWIGRSARAASAWVASFVIFSGAYLLVSR